MTDSTKPGMSGGQPSIEGPADLERTDVGDSLSELVERLSAIEAQLFGLAVVQQVQQLSEAEKQAFVAARLHLSAVIDQLDTAQLSQIAEALAQHTGDLQQGIQCLDQSLSTLSGATAWTSAINNIICVVGQVIPLL